MKKIIGLVVIVLAVAAVLSYLSRDRIQEEIEERTGHRFDGHREEEAMPREGAFASSAVEN